VAFEFDRLIGHHLQLRVAATLLIFQIGQHAQRLQRCRHPQSQ
jgi:uncharacterized cupin superfamily protein